METKEKGWGLDVTSRKVTHYYVNDKSLCGKEIKPHSVTKLHGDDFVPVLGFLCKSCQKKLNHLDSPKNTIDLSYLCGTYQLSEMPEVISKIDGAIEELKAMEMETKSDVARKMEKENLGRMQDFKRELTKILGDFYDLDDTIDDLDTILVIMEYEKCFNVKIEDDNRDWGESTTLSELIDWMHSFNPYGYVFLPKYAYESGEKVIYGENEEEYYYIGKDPFDKETHAICFRVFAMIREYKSIPLIELKPKK